LAALNNVPKFDKTSLHPHCVHLGLGHFHRSHFCDYFQDLINKHEFDWGIVEMDVMHDTNGIYDKLVSQDFNYSLLEKAPDGTETLKIMWPILDYVDATHHPEKAIAVLCSEQTKLVTLTITEKGYHYLESNHSLAIDSPQIQHDLYTHDSFKTAIGLLSEALWRRSSAELKTPLVILSCDNIPQNGTVLKTCISIFLAIKYPHMVSYIEEYVVFPNSMVDRITPNTSSGDIQDLATRYGIEDALAVHCESFKQWIIDDKFKELLPDFSQVGAVFSSEVEAYEKMKIRLLNGSHSALSYPAYLLGYVYVDKACTDPLIHDFIRNRYMEEVSATLNGPEGFDLDSYKDQLLERFSNEFISDFVSRLAFDGSKKIHNAIVPPIIESYAVGSANEAMIISLAFWARFLLGYDESNDPIVIEDDHAEALTELARKAIEAPEPFLRYIGIQDLTECQWVDLTQKFTDSLKEVISKGVRKVLESLKK
jgi:mannitol-1-phosphate/altronate dehydrogenase